MQSHFCLLLCCGYLLAVLVRIRVCTAQGCDRVLLLDEPLSVFSEPNESEIGICDLDEYHDRCKEFFTPGTRFKTLVEEIHVPEKKYYRRKLLKKLLDNHYTHPHNIVMCTVVNHG